MRALLLLLLTAVAGVHTLPLGVERLGRFWQDHAADWPASGIRMLVQSSGGPAKVSIKFGDDANLDQYFIGAILDCQEGPKFEVNRSQLALDFDFELSAGIHELTFLRLSEAQYANAVGSTIFEDVSVAGGRIVAPRDLGLESNCGRKRKLAFFGDSMTAAYGVDGTPPCTFSPDTEDIRHSHAWMTAQALQADLQVVAWSGKGVVRNYGDVNPSSPDPLPFYYNRTLSSKPDSFFDPSLFRADAVVVMLGTNDYSTQPNPSDADFVAGLVAFSNQIQSDYRCPVLLLCAPGASGNQCANIETAAAASGVNFLRISDSAFDGGKGCDGHPNEQTEKNISAQEVPALRKILGLA